VASVLCLVFIVSTLSHLKINSFWTLSTAQVINLTFRTFVLFLASVTGGAYNKATESSRNKYVKVDRDSIVGIATRYGLDGPGIVSR
jgi:hypothetical protein